MSFRHLGLQDELKKAGRECRQLNGEEPNLVVVILPNNGNDIYRAVKL
jgi:eukaryotic translation initiation factor 2C